MISKKILKYTQKITLNTTIWQKYQKLLIANEFKFLTYNFQSLLASNSKTHQHYIQLLNNKRWMEYKNHKIQNKLCCSLVLLLLQQGVGGEITKITQMSYYIWFRTAILLHTLEVNLCLYILPNLNTDWLAQKDKQQLLHALELTTPIVMKIVL